MKRTKLRESQGSLDVRTGVWLAVASMLVVGFAVLVLKNQSTTTNMTDQTPLVSSVRQSSFKRVERSTSSSDLEKVYQGKTLSEWAADLESKDHATARSAVDALVQIGPDAKTQIPSLARLLNSPSLANAVSWALVRIGKDSLPYLTDALTNGPPFARFEVSSAIWWLHADAEEAMPALVECLKDEEIGVRSNAVFSIGRIIKRPDIVVPALVACFEDSDVGIRSSAVTVIREFGKDSEMALASLQHVAEHDPDDHVRQMAAESAKVIVQAKGKSL